MRQGRSVGNSLKMKEISTDAMTALAGEVGWGEEAGRKGAGTCSRPGNLDTHDQGWRVTWGG